MYIEDIIVQVFHNFTNLNRFDKNIISSFYDQIINGKGFTEKQSLLAIKILNRYTKPINLSLGYDITPFISKPLYKFSLRKINLDKKISISVNGDNEKYISVIFPYNEQIITKFREAKDKLNICFWDVDNKCWSFSMDEQSIAFLYYIKNEFSFEIDEDIQNLFDQAKNIFDNFEKYIPVLDIKNNEVKILNKLPYFPEISSQDLLKSVFFARDLSITTWSEEIDILLKENVENLPILEFLNHPPGEIFYWNQEKYSDSILYNFLKYITPTLIIIPVGAELEYAKYILENLKNSGIENKEISILFRLPNDRGIEFNNFVRDNKLNNVIGKNINFFIISGKFPKTLLQNDVKINSVVNYSSTVAHYTIQEFVKSHKNVINMVKKYNNKDLLWPVAMLS